jgi:ABC-2 type transport system ATP-binding protein
MTSVGRVLSVDDVSVSYGKKTVLNDVSLNVSKNETYGFMGLNGAGKTTLIKTILGLRNPQSGHIKVLDHERDHPESKKQMAYLPERFEPPWFLTGLEFIKFSTSLYGVSLSETEIFEECERLALDPAVLKNKTQSYSKGMRQKLGILATLLTGCALFILDEPMSGLDPKARALVKDALQRTKAKGATIFLSSHILTDMDELCDRVALLHEGDIVFEGAPNELKKITETDNMERAFLKKISFEQAA